MRTKRYLAIGVASMAILAALGSTGVAVAAPVTTTVVYDNFEAPGGYTLTNYNEKWANPFGLGEMSVKDTRSFDTGAFSLRAVPFKTGADFSVFDHLKYIGVSTSSFDVPAGGSLEFSADISARTPGTQLSRTIHGTYVDSGQPYAANASQGQQAGVVLNMVDFHSGQLFDWFIAGDTAFALIERLPSTVTGSPSDPSSPDWVGRSKMYTQIIREVKLAPGHTHHVAIRYDAPTNTVRYFLDGVLFSKVAHVGKPLDVQHRRYTGTYPSLGAGEDLTGKITSFSIGHGLFSLLDAFPFQHPDSPELNVSIPLSERLFGQGAQGTFDNISVTSRSAT